MKTFVMALALLFSFSNLAFAHKKESLSETSQVQICTIPLPITQNTNINRLLLNTKHVYVKIHGKTYGTPYTEKQTYFGGDALLYTNDLFRNEGKGEKCYNVHFPINEPEEKFVRRAQCIANKLSVKNETNHPDKAWYPVFSYNFFSHNCASMANYLVQCAGGKPKKTINFSVGDKVEGTTPAKIADQSTGYLTFADSSYGEICSKVNDECELDEEIYNEIALDLTVN